MAYGPTMQAGRVFTFRTNRFNNDELLVRKFEGRESLSRPFEFRIELLSADRTVDSTLLVLQPARLRVKRPLSPSEAGKAKPSVMTEELYGIVSSFVQAEQDVDTKCVTYHAVLVPRMWLLSLSVRSQVFQGKTVPQIVAAVLKEHGFAEGKRITDGQDFVLQLGGGRSYPVLDCVVQYQESDFDFLSRLLEHEGIFYSFDYSAQRDMIVFGDSPSDYDTLIPLTPNYRDLGTFGKGASEAADWNTPEVVHRFVFEHRVVPKGVVRNDYDYRIPTTPLAISASLPAAGTSQPTRFGTHYEFGDSYDLRDETQRQAEANATAKIRAQEVQCREHHFRGSSNCKGFRAGAVFTLKEHYRFDGGYVLTDITHGGQQQIDPTRDMAVYAADYANSFACLPSTTPFRPERVTRKPRVGGSINAFVDASGSGQYAELDSQGRYKVWLPFDCVDRDGGKGSGKASKWVRMAQPYAGGKYGIHFPLHKGTEVLLTHENGDPDRPVIAGAVPNPSTPSPVVNANQTQSVLKSSSGNMFLIDDQSGKERIFIYGVNQEDIRVEGDVRERVGKDRHLTVQGHVLEKISGIRHETIGGDLRTQVGGDRHLTVDKDQKIRVTGTNNLYVDGSMAERIVGDHHEFVQGRLLLHSDGAIHLRSMVGVTLECAGMSIALTPAGISLNGVVLGPPPTPGSIPPMPWKPGSVSLPTLPSPPSAPGLSRAGAAQGSSGGTWTPPSLPQNPVPSTTGEAAVVSPVTTKKSSQKLRFSI